MEYSQIRRVHPQASCPGGTKQCGRESVYKLCYPSSADCPINSIEFSATKQIKPGYSEVSHNDRYIYYSNGQTSNEIPIDFRSEYEGVCLYPFEQLAPEN